MIDLSIDWSERWRLFKEAHGEPINWNGRLLFPDGWTHAAADLHGPEWPPPADREARLRLILTWWRKRKQMVEDEHQELRRQIAEVRDLQQLKPGAPVPVGMRAIVEGRDRDGRDIRYWGRLPVNVDDLERNRLMMLQEEAIRASDQVRSLEQQIGAING